jgi:hypothetical protein
MISASNLGRSSGSEWRRRQVSMKLSSPGLTVLT